MCHDLAVGLEFQLGSRPPWPSHAPKATTPRYKARVTAAVATIGKFFIAGIEYAHSIGLLRRAEDRPAVSSAGDLESLPLQSGSSRDGVKPPSALNQPVKIPNSRRKN